MNKIELISSALFKKKYSTQFNTDVNINHLAELTKDYSCADICSVFMEAKWLADGENCNSTIIYKKHIEEAFPQKINRSSITKATIKNIYRLYKY